MATENSGGLDLASLLSGIAAANQNIAASLPQIQQNAQDAVAININSAELARTAAADARLITGAEQAARLREQAAKQKVGATFGTDISQLDEVYSSLSAQMSEAYVRQRQLAEKIAEKQSVDFFEDPLKYIINNLTINRDINEHNAINAQREAAADQIQKLNVLSSGAAQLQAQFTAPVTAASAEAATRASAYQAQVAANNYTLAGISANTAGIEAVMRMNAQQLQYMFQGKSAINAEEQLQMSRESAARAKREEQRSVQLFNMKLAEQDKENKYNSSVLESINFGRAARGLSPLSGIKADAALRAIQSNNEIGAEFREDYYVGERARESGQVQLAATPADMARRMASKQTMSLPPQQQYVNELFSRALEVAKTSKDGTPWDPTNKDVAGNTAKFNKAVDALVKRDAAEVRVGDTKNLFALPGLQAYAGLKDVQSLPLFASVFAPRIAAGETFDDPGKVLKVTAEAVAKGTIGYKEASANIAFIYQKAQALNLEEKQLGKFGIPAIAPADVGYKVRVALEMTPGVLGGNIPVDFTDPKSIDRAFNKLLVDQKLKSMFIIDRAAVKETIRANTYQGDAPSIYGR
jgi:hypothetical protein